MDQNLASSAIAGNANRCILTVGNSPRFQNKKARGGSLTLWISNSAIESGKAFLPPSWEVVMTDERLMGRDRDYSSQTIPETCSPQELMLPINILELSAIRLTPLHKTPHLHVHPKCNMTTPQLWPTQTIKMVPKVGQPSRRKPDFLPGHSIYSILPTVYYPLTRSGDLASRLLSRHYLASGGDTLPP